MRSGPETRSITDQFLATFEAARRRVLSSCSGSWHWIHSTQTESMLYENILFQMQDVLNGWSHCLHCSKLSLWYHRHQKCSNYFDFWVFFRWTCMDCKHGWMQTILQCSSRIEVFFLPFGTPSLSRPWNWRNSLDQGQGFGRLNGLRWYLTEVPRVVASRCCESESNGTWHFFFGGGCICWNPNGTWSCFVDPVWSCFPFFFGGGRVGRFEVFAERMCRIILVDFSTAAQTIWFGSPSLPASPVFGRWWRKCVFQVDAKAFSELGTQLSRKPYWSQEGGICLGFFGYPGEVTQRKFSFISTEPQRFIDGKGLWGQLLGTAGARKAKDLVLNELEEAMIAVMRAAIWIPTAVLAVHRKLGARMDQGFCRNAAYSFGKWQVSVAARCWKTLQTPATKILPVYERGAVWKHGSASGSSCEFVGFVPFKCGHLLL